MHKRGIFLFFILTINILQPLLAQNQVVRLDTSMFESHQRLFLANKDGWIFKQGNDPEWSQPNLDVSDWQPLKPMQLTADMEDATGRLEGWFRIKIKLDESFEGMPLAISRDLWAATDLYIDGKLIHSFGDTGNPYEPYNPVLKHPIPISLEVGKEYLLTIHFVDYESFFMQRELRLKPRNLQSFINLTGPAYLKRVAQDYRLTHIYGTLTISVSLLLFVLFCLLVFLNPDQKIFQLIATLSGIIMATSIGNFFHTFYDLSYPAEKLRYLLSINLQPLSTLFGLFILEWVLTKRISLTSRLLFAFTFVSNFLAHVFSISIPFGISYTALLAYNVYIVYLNREKLKGANLAVVAAAIVPTIAASIYITIHKYSLDLFYEYDKPLTSLLTLSGPIFLLFYVSVRFKEVLDETAVEAKKVLKVTEEKRELLANQNILLEQQVNARTVELNQSIEDLKATQNQLIHSEKMASLGELTAGIAHEIQNPLNFVNNFSDLNKELIEELKEAVAKNDQDEVADILEALAENEGKINHHGRRAEEIVKSMLQHSRNSSGEKELTDLNALADEYLRLAYHGLRAKDKSFNADFKADLDPNLPKVNVVPQDVGRVLLNLINNAFQAVKDAKDPKVTVSTKMNNDAVEIAVSDNGTGINDDLKSKIFQPFFTTKATGSGTGLGLSLSHDIVTKGHGGSIDLQSVEGEGATFIITLPIK